jgi:hypothetical protein
MTLRTTPLVLGLVAVTFAATGCGQNNGTDHPDR